jgi:hypothetical protein
MQTDNLDIDAGSGSVGPCDERVVDAKVEPPSSK